MVVTFGCTNIVTVCWVRFLVEVGFVIPANSMSRQLNDDVNFVRTKKIGRSNQSKEFVLMGLKAIPELERKVVLVFGGLITAVHSGMQDLDFLMMLIGNMPLLP